MFVVCLCICMRVKLCSMVLLAMVLCSIIVRRLFSELGFIYMGYFISPLMLDYKEIQHNQLFTVFVARV